MAESRATARSPATAQSPATAEPAPPVTRVAVVGSANLDLVASVPRFPGPGETVTGHSLLETPGGKGANQAKAVARVVPCAFVGQLGGDAAAQRILDGLAAAGIDTRYVVHGSGDTGRAVVTVAPDGENSIVVVPLANHDLTPADVCAALDALRPAVVLTQLEIPASVTTATADWCRAHPDSRFVLNPSPVRALAPSIVALADPLVVNVVEAHALLAGRHAEVDLAAALGEVAASVVLTRGARGAVVVVGDTVTEIPALPVPAVDTTGAGDTFAGTLAAYLSTGLPLVAAAMRANAEAARIIQLDRSSR